MKQIYLDADDDITAIINNFEHIESERVALVPPKRSTVLQSVVNLKLLRKAAQADDNELVLVTRDPVITNVASQLKILTAPNLETEPAVPEPKTSQPLPSDTIDGNETDDEIGAVAAGVPDKQEKTPETSSKQAPQAAEDSAEDKPKRSKQVPDFSRFKKRLLLGLLLLLLIGGGLWWALVVAPRAEVAIEGLTRDVQADFDFQIDPGAEASDYQERVLAGGLAQESRTLSSEFEPTGTDIVGERATGEVTIVNCETFSDNSITISSGTALTAANGMVYRASETTLVPGSTSDGPGAPCNEDGREEVPVEADDIGEEYNIGPTDYTVDGYDSDDVFSDGSTPMTGGEEEEVTVVSESDVQEARQSLLEEEREEVRTSLESEFDGDGQFIVETSFNEEVTETVSEPEIGEQTDSARLILETTYTLLAVERDDMEELLATVYREQAETDELLGLVESGLEEATIETQDGADAFNIEAMGVLGPDIDEPKLKEQLVGMGYREAVDTIEDIPNVTNVVVDLWPFWVSEVPSNPDKIEIDFSITDFEEENSGDDDDSGA